MYKPKQIQKKILTSDAIAIVEEVIQHIKTNGRGYVDWDYEKYIEHIKDKSFTFLNQEVITYNQLSNWLEQNRSCKMIPANFGMDEIKSRLRRSYIKDRKYGEEVGNG